MQDTELAERLKRDFGGFTPAGKRIATYLLANLSQLPFETADGIAADGIAASGPRLVTIVNCGFPEHAHNDLSTEMCRLFAAQAGWHWSGALSLGGGTLQYSSANQNDYSGRFSTAANQASTCTTLQPSNIQANPASERGWAYMWHSHNEREITTNNVFPGGMFMIMLVDTREFVIDESK